MVLFVIFSMVQLLYTDWLWVPLHIISHYIFCEETTLSLLAVQYYIVISVSVTTANREAQIPSFSVDSWKSTKLNASRGLRCWFMLPHHAPDTWYSALM